MTVMHELHTDLEPVVTERSGVLIPADPGDASSGRGARWHLAWRGEGATLPPAR